MKKTFYALLSVVLFATLVASAASAYSDISRTRIVKPNVSLKVIYSDGATVNTSGNRECWVYVWEVDRGTNMLTGVAKGKTINGSFRASLPAGRYIATAQKTGIGEDASSGAAYTASVTNFQVSSTSSIIWPKLKLNITSTLDGVSDRL